MQIYNVICVIEEGDSLTSFAFPCSDQDIAENILNDVEELYGESMVTSAIVQSQIDAGLNKQLAIH